MAKTKTSNGSKKKTTRKSSRTSLSDKISLPKPLHVKDVFRPCPTDVFPFSDTKKHNLSHDIIAQDRAIQAINLGLGISKPGYNIYVAGYEGTGKTSVIRSFLEKWAKKADRPKDWIYVYNFDNPEAPKAIEMPTGCAKKFKKHMENLVKDLREEIPAALQSEDYENAVNFYLSATNERKSKLFAELEKLAKTIDFQIKSTRVGIETIPIVDGRPISDKEYGKLDDKQRATIETKRAKLEPEVLDFARKVRSIDHEAREYIENLRSDLGNRLVSSIMEDILANYAQDEKITAYLAEVQKHITENLLDFVDDEEEESEELPSPPGLEEKDARYRKYAVNVFLDHTSTKGAPIVIEGNPTYYNLFGKVEKNVEHGMYYTDFTMVKAGAIHRANGGYIVINILDIFRNPSIWETLKRVLRNREAFIEDMGEQYSMLPTSGLRPEPIPLDTKVIIIGNDDIYHHLYEEDEEFRKIFKVKADFDYKMERTKRNINAYAAFIATRTIVEELLPFDRSGIAAIIEFSSRLVEDQRYLTSQFGEIKGVIIEADYYARGAKAKQVKRDHVEKALENKFYRLGLVEEHLLEMVKYEDVLLAVDGERIGQVNGLSVYDMGDYSFGKIGRITCTTSIGTEGIFNVERASRLSGKIHDKGMHILTGFLNGLLARERSLGISARVCFEQSYGYIDGDSASIAELVAIISAMSQIPVQQSVAMTGSVNQLGDVQPIGGVNEKVEGFVKTCRLIGKKKSGYRLLIPVQNVPNLMLQRYVREAIEDGYIEIIPIQYFWQAFALATGVDFGIRDFYDEAFSPDSALAIIHQKLANMHHKKIIEAKEVHTAK